MTQCSDDEHTTETIPEATQTGRGIFACLVDGKPFIDKSGNPNEISFNAYYQLIDGEYYFNVRGTLNNNNIGEFATIKVATNEKSISQGSSYQLFSDAPGNAWGGGAVNISTTNNEFAETSQNYTGQLIITKLDVENQIVSGAFWMNLKHPITGDTVKITEGRFDTRFGL